MPSADSQPPNGSRYGIILLTIIVLGIGAVVAFQKKANHPSDKAPVATATNAVLVTQPPATIVTNITATSAPQPAAPGTIVSAEEVLSKVDKWLAEHPNYHLNAVTSFPNGSIVGKMDVFSYTNEAEGSVVAMTAQMSSPQSIEFKGVKKNGKLQVYFPISDQIIEPDLAQSMAAMPVMGGANGGKALLKLAKSSFAEASADLEVATLVLNTETLKMSETPSTDIYLSIRINNQGELLGIDEQVQGQRILTTMKYVTFDRDTVAREAPALPLGKLAVTNKSLEQAMQEEVRLVINKPLRTKI
jgi:hypothetical protein